MLHDIDASPEHQKIRPSSLEEDLLQPSNHLCSNLNMALVWWWFPEYKTIYIHVYIYICSACNDV